MSEVTLPSGVASQLEHNHEACLRSNYKPQNNGQRLPRIDIVLSTRYRVCLFEG